MDPLLAIDIFSSILISNLDKAAPYVTRSLNRPLAPWITPGLKTLCKKRDDLYKRARRINSTNLLVQYRTLRCLVKEKLLQARQGYLLT